MQPLTDEKIMRLKKTANDIRKSIIEMLLEAGSGHTAGPLGITDILTYIYFNALKHDPRDPLATTRDRLVISNGHICPALYATMAYSGYFGKDELKSLRKFGSRLQGHPHREFLPNLETSSGPLGEGLSQAVGMAIIDQLENGVESKKKIYCLASDGEQDEGQIWEAAMLASKYKLDNLILIIDRNNIQLSGRTEDIMPLGNLAEKWASFGWHVIEIDGHDFREIDNAIFEAKKTKFKPSVIIAYTIPGKGVKKWEGDYRWHGEVPNKVEAEIALKELDN